MASVSSVEWTDTHLHNVGAFGAVAAMGVGNLGETKWTAEALVSSVEWTDTHLHNVGAFGAVAAMGVGNLGETKWGQSL